MILFHGTKKVYRTPSNYYYSQPEITSPNRTHTASNLPQPFPQEDGESHFRLSHKKLEKTSLGSDNDVKAVRVENLPSHDSAALALVYNRLRVFGEVAAEG